MVKFHRIVLNFHKALANRMPPLNPNTLNLELRDIENVSYSKGCARFFFAIFTIKCLKSVPVLLSLGTFPLIKMTGPENAEKTSFKLPKQHNLSIYLSKIALSFSFTQYGQIRNVDLSVTSISRSMLGHVPISSPKLSVSLYLYSMSMTPFFSDSERHDILNLYTFLLSLCLIYFSFHHPFLIIDFCHLFLLFPFSMHSPIS